MMRLIIIGLGWICYFFSNKKKALIKLYYRNLYTSQLNASNYSFGKHFNLSIDHASKINLLNDVCFSNFCHIEVLNGGRITIGENTYFNNSCSITALKNISIGSNCLFGECVKVYDHNHKFNKSNKLIKEQGYTTDSISIGNNIWVGSNVVILKGVNIGDNSVIGAGCVVCKNVPPNSIVKLKSNLIHIEPIIYED